MWNEKFVVLAGAAVSVILIYFAVGLGTSLVTIRWSGAPRALLPTDQTVLIGLFLLATVCAAGFWTLQARTLLGGMTFCIGSQFLVAIVVNLVLERIYGNRVGGLEDPIVLRWIVVVGLIYSAVFLWAGRQKFARLQLKWVGYGDSGPLLPFGGRISEFLSRYSGWLRCRPKWATANLIRKELRLQKPLFVIAAVFSLCWVVTLILLLLSTSDWQAVYEVILNVITTIWVVLLAVLAGCVSLGEEKTMGVAEWQLTLPCSARKQWLVKLCTSAVVGLVLGIGLPLALAILASVKSHAGLYFLVAEQAAATSWLFFIWGLVFVLGFWAVTLLGSTIRATLNTIVVLIGLAAVAGVGVTFAKQFGGLEQWLILPLIVYFHLAPDAFGSQFLTILTLVAFFAGPLVVTALWQSMRQFRRAQVQRWVVWKYSLILLAIGLVMSTWATDLGTSWAKVGLLLNTSLTNAVKALPAETIDASKPTAARKITLNELEETGKLAPLTKAWLKGATMELTSEQSKGPTSKSTTLVKWITVEFPNGARFRTPPVSVYFKAN